MSKYRVNALDADHHAVIVGWDHRLQTFFAEVWDLVEVGDPVEDVDVEDLDDDEHCVVWVDADVICVPTVTALAQAIAAYAMLPADIAAQLKRDRAVSESRVPLQQWVRWVRSGLLSLIQRYGCRRAGGSERERK